MKRINIFTYILIIIGLSIFSACNPDQNTVSNQDVRDQYIGSWSVVENGKKLNYEVQITADPNNSSQVLINNFYDYNIKPYAIVTISSITLPAQSFGKSITVNGSGSFANNKITWTYYANHDQTQLDTIHSVYTKQ
ncbi:MAG: hypothetical protein NTU44_09205 [Bacteroidetes bacterium]|nr:hypothetical protein [Bacteroidota bacterium]